MAAVPRVVLISLDGFASFYWTDPRVRMPTLRRLAERGVVARRMECVFPSTTWPTHVRTVSGGLALRGEVAVAERYRQRPMTGPPVG